MRGTHQANVLLETFSQRRIQHLLTLLLLPMLMLPCSLYQPAALAAATPASVGYDVETDGRRVAKMCFGRRYSRALVRRCSSRVLLVIIIIIIKQFIISFYNSGSRHLEHQAVFHSTLQNSRNQNVPSTPC